MPSDMREAVARAICAKFGRDPDELLSELGGRPRVFSYGFAADAALAVIRERLAEKVPEGDDRNAPIEMSSDEAHGWRAGWNACRAAMLRELGGEG